MNPSEDTLLDYLTSNPPQENKNFENWVVENGVKIHGRQNSKIKYSKCFLRQGNIF